MKRIGAQVVLLATALVAACGGRSALSDIEAAPPATGSTAAGAGGSGPEAKGNGGNGAEPSSSGGWLAGGAVGGMAGESGPCDRDRDGYVSLACGGPDCNDEAAGTHPDAWDTNAEVGAWSGTQVLSFDSGDTSDMPAVAVDRGGAVHVSLATAGLRYATDETGTWDSVLLDERARWGSSLVVSDETVHIAYRADGGVWLASRLESSWSVEQIQASGVDDSMMFPGVALAARVESGGLYAAYFADGSLHYAVRVGDAWQTEQVSNAPTAAMLALAVDGDGVPHLGFGSDEGVWYGTKCPSGWCVNPLVTERAGPAALRLDAQGRVHMAYSLRRIDAVVTHQALLDDGSWRSTLAAPDAASSLSMAAAPPGASNPIHIIYESFEFETAYLRGGENGWTRELLASSRDATSLALEGASVAHLASTSFRYPRSTILEHSTNRVLRADGIDQNCDGIDGIDRDRDGEASIRSGGQDCDDRDAKIRVCDGDDG